MLYRGLHALCPPPTLGPSPESLYPWPTGASLLSLWFIANGQALLSQLPLPFYLLPAHLPPCTTRGLSAHHIFSFIPRTEELTESHLLDPFPQPGLTCERALWLPTGSHHAHGLTAAPGGQRGRDGHPHCTDVETEAQAGEGKHSGSSTPSTRLALQCDM